MNCSSQSVFVVRNDEGIDLEDPIKVDIISVPAIDLRESLLSNQEYQASAVRKLKGKLMQQTILVLIL